MRAGARLWWALAGGLAAGACSQPNGEPGDPCEIHADCKADICALGRCLGANADRDGDGLSNATERLVGTDPTEADSDRDGIDDRTDVGPDPTRPLDSDGDRIPDFRERTDADRDQDGIFDDLDGDDAPPPVDAGVPCASHAECNGGACIGRECRAPEGDLDEDQLSNGQEVLLGTNPINADSDGDGQPDGIEVGADPAAPADSDGDGLIDALESATRDTDGDRIPDEVDPS